MQLVPGFEKEIVLNSSKHNTLSITPGMYGSFSSLNFYESTVNRRLNTFRNPKIKQAPASGTLQSTTTVDNKGFKFLDMEITFPISYELKNWNISFIPTYAIPFNKITTTSVNTTIINGVSKTVKLNSTPYSETHLANIFFFDFGITYKF